MKIIISPAKKMKNECDWAKYKQLPSLIDDADIIRRVLITYSVEKLQELMQCNEEIARLNYERYQKLELNRPKMPALLAYEGLQFQHIAADIFTDDEMMYVNKHLYILSGLYGILKADDGISPYRLEMGTKLRINSMDNLYEFWNDKIYNELFKDEDFVLNLASAEYSRCITPFLNSKQKFITVVFKENKDYQLINNGTQAKICRGELVRYIAVNKIKNIERIKDFTYNDYAYNRELSSPTLWCFVKNCDPIEE